MDYIVRAWADGLDFIGTEIHRKSNVKAARTGLGDMICEISNLCQSKYFNEGGTILAHKYHPALNSFISLLPFKLDHWKFIANPQEFNNIVNKSYDWNSLNSIRNILHCHSEYNDYIKLDKNKFIECNDLIDTNTEYATIQRKAISQKCEYNNDHIKYMEDQYQLPIVEIGGHDNLGLSKCAYIINKAKFHIGIDSGMTHLALTIKDKKDVHIYVPKKRQTSVTYRWINKKYEVHLI